MTIEERADNCMYAINHIGDGLLYDEIVAAITAAIEEERERWAKIADEEASAPAPVETYYLEGYRGAMRHMAHLLRSTASPAEEENAEAKSRS